MIKIKHDEMVSKLAKSGVDILAEISAERMHLLHMVIGIAGESGEILEALDNCSGFLDIDRNNLIEELGDAEFYLEGARQGIEIKRPDTLELIMKDFDYSSYGSNFKLINILSVKLAMESCKLLDLVKKVAFYNKLVDMKQFMVILNTIELYLEGIRRCIDVTHKATIDGNINKLGKRYKDHQYSDSQAQDRADKK